MAMQRPEKGKLGLAVAELTPDVRQQLHIPSQVNGVAVQSVRPASPAEDAGLAPGDVILEVDRKPVTSAEQFVNEAHATPAGKDAAASGVVAGGCQLPCCPYG